MYYWKAINTEAPKHDQKVIVYNYKLNEVYEGYYSEGHFYDDNGEKLNELNLSHWQPRKI
ncbi:MAG: hypothetical protein U9O59_01840 [Actinomycetota bacterium]|nr:hypothetical protein [Actinomycetota bacterium]